VATSSVKVASDIKDVGPRGLACVTLATGARQSLRRRVVSPFLRRRATLVVTTV